MEKKYDFKLTPAYCLYNGAAVLEQSGSNIKFLVENKKDAVLCGRLSRAFENHVGIVRQYKDCPEEYRRIIKTEFISGTRAQLRKCVSNLYRAEKTTEQNEKEADFSKNRREAAAVLLLDSILNEARVRGASDIHIEKGCVRLRINGNLETLLELQNEKSSELVQRIKLLAGMNVMECRRCQDGHFVYGNKNPFFLRVSTMAVMGEEYTGSESLVLRLLDTSRIPLALGELGFNEVQLEKLCGDSGLTSLKNGLVLVCGPTGAGKSTTVAAMLVEIEKQAAGSLKIISLEDPPEYVIPGVTQVKVDERNSFSDSLNHLFRQDPDVIMIGEIRDEESAAAALRASLTGHLVFATLHSGSASEAIFRLENLGLDRKPLCEVLRAVLCQELNLMDGKMRLCSDLAIPAQAFAEKAGKMISGQQLENLLEHYTNFSEVLGETLVSLKKKSEKRNIRTKPLVPLLKRRNANAGIHKGAV